MQLKKDKYFTILFCFIISFLILMIVSKSSFLYPMNNWNDANAFFTMGKSLMNGKVIFKEIFEQKGPLLYFIYGIGYLISNKSFLGIFILEILSSTVFSYYICKIINIYLDKKYAYLILPIFLMLLYSSSAFASGGSCEEFCLPFLGYTLYQLFVCARKKDIDYKKIYLVGFMAGLIFLMKYTALGVSFGFCVYIFVQLLQTKKYKKALIFPFMFFFGFISPMIPWLLYFIFNSALYEFINSYILINALSYGNVEVSLFSRIYNCLYFFLRNLYGAGKIIFVLFCLIIVFLFVKNKVNCREKIAVICSIFFTVLFIYIGGTYLYYYVFPVCIFIIFSLIGIVLLLNKYLNKINIKIASIVIVLVTLIGSYFLSSNTKLMKNKKEELPQYQFAEIINSYDNPTLLNYGFLDEGFYTVTGIIPNTKYFEKLNFKYDRYPENIDSLNNYIKNKEVEFVVYIKGLGIKEDYPVTVDLENNYELLAESSNININNYTYYLYKIK